MATDKFFTVVGVSTLNGETKLRFANDIMRIKVLAKHGHTDIRMIEMDSPKSKLEAATFIQTLDEFSDNIAQAAIGDYLDRGVSKPAKVAKVKAPKVKAEKAPTKSTKVVDEDEDKPFGFAELEAAVGEALL